MRDGALLRDVRPSYEPHYRRLMDSGLYRRLVDARMLVPHEEERPATALAAGAYKVLRPEPISLITYPYEWCFSQLKRAALLTLSIEQLAMEHGMTLKDASAFNVQFRGTNAVWIDTLSFEIYEPGAVWRPYLQFCRHFLAPLALMAYADPRALQLTRAYVEGLPLDLACSLLPLRSRLRLGLLLHLHLHSRAERTSGLEAPKSRGGLGAQARKGLIDGLRRTVEKLDWTPRTTWSGYGEHDTYSVEGAAHKKELVSEYLAKAAPKEVWDLGANIGAYSRLASDGGTRTFAWDSDAGAVELAYRAALERGDANLLPLVLDVANPSPALGWALGERESIKERCRADVVMALALTHHLVLGAGIPFEEIASFFAELAPWLIIEHVDRADPKAARMLATRGEVRPYTREAFEGAFRAKFDVVSDAGIRGSERHLYLMRRRGR